MDESYYYQQLEELQRPFSETADFRDFIVWLCGYTDREGPPTQTEWNALKRRVKQIAAKFATDAHERAQEELRKRYSAYAPLTTSSGVFPPSADTNYTYTSTNTY